MREVRRKMRYLHQEISKTTILAMPLVKNFLFCIISKPSICLNMVIGQIEETVIYNSLSFDPIKILSWESIPFIKGAFSQDRLKNGENL